MLIQEKKHERKIYSQNLTTETAETLLKDLVTDPTGYIPLKSRIEAFEAAGENLEKWRDENFDYESDYDDPMNNADALGQYAIRTMGSDIVDIQYEQEAAYFRLLQQTKQPRRRDEIWQEESDFDQPEEKDEEKNTVQKQDKDGTPNTKLKDSKEGGEP